MRIKNIEIRHHASNLWLLCLHPAGQSENCGIFLYLMFASKTCTVESLSKDTVSITSLTALWNSVTLPSTCREKPLKTTASTGCFGLTSSFQVFCPNSIFSMKELWVLSLSGITKNSPAHKIIWHRNYFGVVISLIQPCISLWILELSREQKRNLALAILWKLCAKAHARGQKWCQAVSWLCWNCGRKHHLVV